MDDNKTEVKVKRQHNLQIEGRKKALITGVEKVISMTETLAQVITSAGGLMINGKNMHMSKYNAEEGLLIIEGNIDRAAYTQDSAEKGSFLKRLFK